MTRPRPKKPDANLWSRSDTKNARRLLRAARVSVRERSIKETRGLSHAEAARRVGVSASTMRRWRQQRGTRMETHKS
jgi:transposase